jgi:hypothetical protein
LANYNTSLSLMALTSAADANFLPVILKAREFIASSQMDMGVKGTNDMPFDGGVGYGSKYDHSDMNNTLTATRHVLRRDDTGNAGMEDTLILNNQKHRKKPAGFLRLWVALTIPCVALGAAELTPETDSNNRPGPAGGATNATPQAFLQKLQFPGVAINVQEQCVDVESSVCLHRGALELVACTKGTKEHESIVAIEAKPMHIERKGRGVHHDGTGAATDLRRAIAGAIVANDEFEGQHLLRREARQLLGADGPDRLVVTDSILPTRIGPASGDRLVVLEASKLFGEAIRRICAGESVVALREMERKKR